MSESGFTQGGYTGAGITEDMLTGAKALYTNMWTIIYLVVIIAIIIFISYKIGKSAKESFGTGQALRLHDNEREPISSGALETGFAANPNNFCSGAGASTDNADTFLYNTAYDNSTSYDESTGGAAVVSEGLSSYDNQTNALSAANRGY